MEECERRHAQRYPMRIPLTFRPVTPAKLPKCYGEIVNISPHGVCFSTYSAVATGTTLKVFLKLPKDVIGHPSPEWCWTGKVVHIRSRATGGVEMGVRFMACDAPSRHEEV